MGKFEDLTGKKFNRLTVFGLGNRHSSSNLQWEYRWENEIVLGNYNGNVDVIAETLFLLQLHI